MMKALVNATVYTVGGPVLESGTVIIKDGKIAAVGSNLAIPPNCRVYDCQGMVITPGFIDASTRLGIHEDGNGQIGYDEDEATQAVTPHLRAIDALYPKDVAFDDAVKAGVTTAMVEPGNSNVIGGICALVKTCGDTVEDMLIDGRVALKVSLAGTPPYLHKPRGRSEAVALFLRELQKARDFLVKQETAHEESDEELDERLRPVVELLRQKLPAVVYAPYNHDIVNALEIARDWGFKLIIERAAEGHLVLEELQAAGVPVIAGPITAAKTLSLANATTRMPALLANAGVRVALTTNHPHFPVRYLFVQAATAARDGMDIDEALKSITLYPALIWGIADRVGSIDPGKDADLVVWDNHPFAVCAKVQGVFIDGQLCYAREGSVLSC